jgi:hypothetical protein
VYFFLKLSAGVVKVNPVSVMESCVPDISAWILVWSQLTAVCNNLSSCERYQVQNITVVDKIKQYAMNKSIRLSVFLKYNLKFWTSCKMNLKNKMLYN